VGVTVTAVVPTLGASPLLAECVRALHGQEVPIEVVLVRQGPQALDEGALRHGTLTDSTLGAPANREIALPENVGFAAATNRGIGTATGKYVATVNDDVVVGEGWAGALVEALEADPTAAAAQGVNLIAPLSEGSEGSSTTGPDDLPVDGWGIGWNRTVQAIQLGRGEPPPRRDAPSRRVFGVSATAALYRREALLRVALPGSGRQPEVLEVFDSRLESYYEDVDLARRLRAAGYTALSVPRARARHAGSLTGQGLGARRWRLIYGNRYAVAAGLLGSGFWRAVPKMAARDLADLAAAVGALDGAKILGIKTGWCRALRLVPGFTRGGAPVPVDVEGAGSTGGRTEP